MDQDLQQESLPDRPEGSEPLEPGAFGEPSEQAKRHRWRTETIARARAIAGGLGDLHHVEDAELRNRISTEFDTQVQSLVAHVMRRIIERDASGSWAAATSAAVEALGLQSTDELPFLRDIAIITRDHIEEMVAETGALSETQIARLTGVLEPLLETQLDRLAAVEQKNPPQSRASSGEAPRAAA